MADSQKTSLNFSTKQSMKKGKAMGKTDMGIPPFKQKVKKLHKISPMAKSSKRSTKGSDEYC